MRQYGSSMWALITRGGLMCQCVQGHVLARDSTYGLRETAQLGRPHSERDNSLGGDYVSWKTRMELLFVETIQ
jgi:hypothetical protein